MSDWNVVKTEKLDDWTVVSQEQPTAGFLESLGISLGESLKGARRLTDSVRVLANELPSAQRQFRPGTVSTNEEIFNEQRSLEGFVDSLTNPDKKKAHWSGQLAAGVPTMLLNLASSPFTTGQTFLDQGESLGRAGAAAGIDTVMNAAGVALPVFGPMRNAGKLVGAATGAGANIAQDVASRSMIQAVAEKESTKKIFENTPETIALAGITGGVFGGAAVPSRKSTANAKADLEALKAKLAEKEVPATPAEPAMTPLQVKAQRDWMDASIRAREQAAANLRDGQPAPSGEVALTPSQLKAQRDWMDASTQAREQAAEKQREMEQLGSRLPGDNTPLPWKPTGEVIGRKHEQSGEGNEGRVVKDVLNNQEADLPFKDPNALDFTEFYAGRLADDLDAVISRNNSADLADKVTSIINENPALYKQVLDILQGNGKLDNLTKEVLQILQTGKPTPPTPPKPTFRGNSRPTLMGSPARGGMGKQSGKVDFQGISESLSKATERIANAFKSQKTSSDHILKLTGVDMIKKGPNADDMLARQAAAGPVPEANFWMNWNSGLSMLADKFPQVPLIKDMNQWLRYTHRKIAKSDREVRQPLEKLAVQLGKDSQAKMAAIAKSESLRQQYYTDADYVEFGLNPKEIKFMRSVQEAHRISNELQSTSAIESLGKGVREQAGYYTHDFSGPVKITATVIGKDGKPTTYRAREDSVAKAQKAEAWLKANRGATDIVIEQLHTNYDHNRSHDRTRSSLEALIEIHSGNEDKVSIVKDLLSDLERARAEGVSAHDQHLYDKKTFAEGYAGDRPWRSDVENATDWWQKQINMTSETARWSAINEMMAEYKKVMADPEVQKMGKFKDVINEYVLQEMGMRSSTWKAFEETSMKALMDVMPEKLGKGDVAALKDFLAGMKSLAYIKALSASAGYTIVTPFQVAAMGIPEYGRLLATGEVRAQDGTHFLLDVIDGMTMGMTEKKSTIFSANQKMWDFFVENNVVPRRVIDDYKNVGSNRQVDATMSFLNFTIAKPDQMARAAAAFAFGKALERGGKFATPEAAWERAAEVTSKVAMPITKQDRPLAVDSAGQLGNMAFFLHTPFFTTWNAANIFVRNIAQAETPKQKAKATAAFSFFLAAMAASGGLMEMLGVNEIAQVADIALGAVSEISPELYASARDLNLTKNMLNLFPEHRILNEVLNYGAQSSILGLDLSSRFSQGAGDLSKPWEAVTGVPGIMKDMFVDPPVGAVQSLVEGSTRPLTQDLANALPPLGRGLLQSQHGDFKSHVQPNQEAYPGYANYRKSSDHKDTSINTTKTPAEQDWGMVGLRSLDEGKRRRIDRVTQVEAQRDQAAIAQLNKDLFYTLTTNPDKLGGKFRALLKLDPLAAENSINALVKKVEESPMTQTQKDALKAKTMLAFKRIKDNQGMKNAAQLSGN